MNDATTPTITSASVKVMRSYDYCHFEVVLGTTNLDATGCPALTQIDNLRKEAARLADKAVAQYKIAKEAAEQRRVALTGLKYGHWKKDEIERIRAMSETDRSEDEKATLKEYDDAVFASSRQYDYQDDWQDEDEDEEDLAPGY